MQYFVCGSNMDWLQMREHCPSAHFVGIALLPDHKLAPNAAYKNLIFSGARHWHLPLEEQIEVTG
jgi:hypothetical protein